MKAKHPLAIGKIILPLGILVLIISNIILVHEVIKLKKTSQIQSTIEARRVALMVIYQKVLTNNTKEIAEKYDFDRKKLLIEITEDSLEKNLVTAMYNIIKVKELGFRIALDDIGSGYTSFISLCEYPIGVIKLDREILLLTGTEKGKKLFKGLVSLAHNLNLTVVCEGVETEEQNNMVSNSDCDYIQGWYYTKALPEKKAEAFARGYMNKFI